jgi:hypothetical protein
MKSFFGLVTCLALFAACKSSAPASAESHSIDGAAVVDGHVHSGECAHYRLGPTWYHDPVHEHSSKCPHNLEDGVWVLR